MDITYKTKGCPDTAAIIALYISSGLNRPTSDHERIHRMYANSNLIVTAWDGDKLVGIARSLTDFCYSCYLSDLAVHLDYQKSGIGKQLVALTKESIGKESMLLLLSAPTAMTYYPRIGMDHLDNAFMIKREA
ncbi:GNAT family N-acetyltransferase [Pedobacter sp. FW305-3-2-15-E-R2A2]|jgi:predicted N-acetyltransferase YhbS|uniref:GNAT family N-acetyltransferase n=1 Tax=Pedobacter sp. FW305-3-2-15-E-R2A2 TaxID=3140251 RepID=UPI003140579B